MKNLGDMMKQAQAMQEKLQDAQARLAETEVEGTAGGGMVAVTLKGVGELTRLDIDESLLTPGEGEILADLVIAAHADATPQAGSAAGRADADAAGPLAGIPGMPTLVCRRSDLAASAGPEIERLIALLAKLPGLGPRSARRAALALLKRKRPAAGPAGRRDGRSGGPRARLLELRLARHPRSLRDLRRRQRATAALICVVEEVGALWAMERAGAFRGRYHVLGGLLSALDGVGPEALRIDALVARAAGRGGARGDPGAAGHRRRPDHRPLSRRPPGRAGVAVTSLARGVPVGGDLDWLDDGTIAQALRARRPT